MSLNYHMIAFVGGFFLDLLLGDPHWLYHPVRLIGNLISYLERKLNQKNIKNEKVYKNGIITVLLILIITFCTTFILLMGAYKLHPCLGLVMELVMTYQVLAARCLKVESMKVYQALCRKDLEQARTAVSMIVGRDTQILDDIGVTKAAVETIAENTSDGVIAPMLYLALGGPVLGFVYKAVNTMDSMLGYKNERFLYFGRAAAKLDDVVNYLPARISAAAMILVSYFLGILPIYRRTENGTGEPVFSGKRAAYIFKRDRYQHASPNSAQTEAVCAGSLGIQLAGDASYFGKILHKPYIGDPVREVEYEDIRRANWLLYGTAFFCELACIIIMCVVMCLMARVCGR